MQFFVFFCFLFVLLGWAQAAITFDLSNYNPSNRHVFKQVFNLTKPNEQIDILNVPPQNAFYVIQIHTFIHNLTISTSAELKAGEFVSGTNTGLVGTKNATFYLSGNVGNNTVYAVVIVYNSAAPIPGGCNLTFDTPVAPYQLLSYTDHVIVVQSQPAGDANALCEKTSIETELYHLYLQEHNYSPSDYFNGIEKMLTVESIRANGFKVATVDGYFTYNKLYSAYRGVGRVFAIVATSKLSNRSSAYVPAVSYGCDLANSDESCFGPVTPHWNLICAIIFIFGLYICFFGHKCFRLTLYLFGFLIGVFITYAILSLNANLTDAEKTTTSILIGLIYGSVWLLIWWKFGIPIVSVALSFFMAGFLIASIIFYAGVADMEIFRNDANYWLTLSSIVLACCILWTMVTMHSHLFVCSFLGAYGCITALNYYTGGNLQYILINAYRRIAIKDFNMATIDPPFQLIDGYQTIFWATLTVFGFYYQLRGQRGKPPFPSPRFAEVASERTPLLYHPPQYTHID